MKSEEIKKSIADLEEALSADTEAGGILPQEVKEDMATQLEALYEKLEKPEPATAKKPASSPKQASKKKAESLPTQAQMEKHLNYILPSYELNLPFHKGISETEKTEVVMPMAKDACKHFNCMSGNQVPSNAMKMVKSWLNKKNKQALRAKKSETRRDELPEEVQSIIDACAAFNSKRSARRKTSSSSKPKKKTPFGTKLKKGLVTDFKRVYLRRVKQEGGKSKADLDKLNKEMKGIASDQKKVLARMAKFAGLKASPTLLNGFMKDVESVLLQPQKPE